MMLFIVVVGACNNKSSNSSSTRPSFKNEDAYCATVSPVTNGVTLRAQANYEYFRAVYPGGLADNSNPAKPIRYAEVRVKNSLGAIVQCGETDALGQVLVEIPKPSSSESYTVEVGSRGYNQFIKASVLDSPYDKNVYRLSLAATVGPSDSAVDFGTMMAPRRVSSSSPFKLVEGGAFHILDTLVDVNEFLRTNLSNCVSEGLCEAFTTVSKINVYWKIGFNPSSYFQGISSPLSFMVNQGAGQNQYDGLYILGGLNGDYNNSDTDHFDKCVIIHEYTHHLESTYWITDSPGGTHGGYATIDPRLAFSEGTAYFFPMAVMSTKDCVDTKGSPDGSLSSSSKVLVYIDGEDETQRDQIANTTASIVGEGLYREYSVTRALYDYWDSVADALLNSQTDTIQVPFTYIWGALSNTTFGVANPNLSFRSMDNFNSSLSGIIASKNPALSSEFDNVRLAEFQTKDGSQYATALSEQSVSCPQSLEPLSRRKVPFITRDVFYDDIFVNSDFFEYNHGGGTLNLKMDYALVSAGLTLPNLDLYIFREVHSSDIEDADWLAASARISALDSGQESLSLVNLPAGRYMIRVNVPTSSDSQDPGNEVNYTLEAKINDGSWRYLCP